MQIHKDVWLGADNIFTLQLQDQEADSREAAAVPMDAVTKMELFLYPRRGLPHKITTNAGDSDPSLDWESPTTTGNVIFRLGIQLKTDGVPTGTYRAELQLYDPVNTNGLVWLDKLDKDLTIRVLTEAI